MSMAYWNTPTKCRKANQRKERHKPLDEDVPSEPSDDATCESSCDDDVDDEVPTPKAHKTPSKKAKAASKELTEDEEEGSDEERSKSDSCRLEKHTTDVKQNWYC